MAAATHLTTEELAERLHRSPRTVKDWRVDGKGPRYIPGTPVLYPVAEVEAWEQRQLVKTTA